MISWKKKNKKSEYLQISPTGHPWLVLMMMLFSSD